MSRARIILRNVASNWVGYAVHAVVTLALTPFILRELGQAGYGLWILSSSVIGYYGLLDLGFRAGVTQYLTRYLASGDYQRASECLSGAVAALGGLGVVMIALSLGAAWAVPYLFQVPPELTREAFWCVLIVGVSAGFQFALSPYTSIFTATQRFDLANLIGICTRLLTAAMIIAALKLDYGLIGVSVATCLASSIDYLVRWRVSRRLAPQLELSIQHVKLARLKEVGSFGAWNFLISISIYIYQNVPSMLVGLFMPIAAVGQYSLAMGLIRQIVSILLPIGQVVYPAAAAAHVRGEHDALERLYHDGSRLLMLLMFLIALNAAFWAEDFYRLWIGEQYLTGQPFHSVAVLFQVLLLGSMAACSNLGGQILMGAGHVKSVALAMIASSAINVSLAMLLIGPLGLLGVACGSVAGSVVVDLVAIPLLLQRKLGLSFVEYLRRACLRPALTALLQVIWILAVHSVARIESWAGLVGYGLLSGAGCALIVLYVGVTSAERSRFVMKPLYRLAGWEARGEHAG